jgi:hypothetical protein
VEPLAAARDASLAGFERIRWARDSLVGVQRTPDGGERAVRLTIADGRVASIAVIDNDFSSADHPIATVSGDDFYLLVHQSSGDAGDLVIRRSRVH